MTLNHKDNFFKSLLTIFSNVSKSSAHRIAFKLSDMLHKSFIKSINSSGPNINPCGIPYLTKSLFELQLLNETY